MKRRFLPRSFPLRSPTASSEVCLEIQDHSITRRSAVDFFQLRGLRDPSAPAARLAGQFVTQNQALLRLMDVEVQREYDGSDVLLSIQAGNAVGAVPLLSPTSARPDFGLVIQPRFPWDGIGPMLGEMGWRVSPSPLRLPLLRRSERRVPVWVLASMILTRLQAMLSSLDRRFEFVEEDRRSPRGSVNWSSYATQRLPRGDFLSVPCRFPDLRDDRLLKGAIRYCLHRQIAALETQSVHGPFVRQLIVFAEDLMRRVSDVPPYVPHPTTVATWLQRPLRTDHFAQGLQAIEWTVEERGLAGISDLEGIPWRMPMDQFFEAWVETVATNIVRRTGGRIRVGRKDETRRSIYWRPSYLGSQRSFVPDIWIEWDAATLIVDAKYKRHWEEMHHRAWSRVEEEIREQHRADLMQVLAYANLATTPTVIACLTYPCSFATFRSLVERRRLIHSAEVTAGSRSVHLLLLAIPMSANVDEIAAPLAEHMQALLRST